MRCMLTPSPLYPRACFFVGGREGPRRRLLSLKGQKEKDIGWDGVPAALKSLFDPTLFLSGSLSIAHLCPYSQR